MIRLEGFRKPQISKPKRVSLAMITSTHDVISCSCGGWATRHPRQKVREDRAQKHIDSAHGGFGVWL